MPRLLYVTTTPAIIRNFLLPYAAHFRELGWEVHAAARSATEAPAIVAAFDGVHELPLSRSLRDPVAIARGLGRLRALTTTLAPDLIHVHSPIAGFVTRFAVGRAPLAERPALVYTAHGFHAHPGGRRVSNAVYSTMETVAGRWTDALYADLLQRKARAVASASDAD